MKFHLVANPKSGRGKGVRNGVIATRLLRERGHDVEYLQGHTVEESRDLIASAVHACDGLIVSGGDGMVHLAIQSLAGTPLPLGIIPSGTGNDAARSLGLPLKSIQHAVEVIDSNQRRQVDLGLVTSDVTKRWFLQILSTGFDSVVNERANSYRWPRGRMKYNIAMVATLPRFKPISYHISNQTSERDFRAMLVAIANGPSYGGGMLVCPDASFDDQQLDVMVLQPLGKLRFLALFPRVYRGTHVFHPRVSLMRDQAITLTGPAIAYADGERIGPLPLRAEVVAHALQVFAPKSP